MYILFCNQLEKSFFVDEDENIVHKIVLLLFTNNNFNDLLGELLCVPHTSPKFLVEVVSHN